MPTKKNSGMRKQRGGEIFSQENIEKIIKIFKNKQNPLKNWELQIFLYGEDTGIFDNNKTDDEIYASLLITLNSRKNKEIEDIEQIINEELDVNVKNLLKNRDLELSYSPDSLKKFIEDLKKSAQPATLESLNTNFTNAEEAKRILLLTKEADAKRKLQARLEQQQAGGKKTNKKSLDNCTVAELKERAVKRGVKVSGMKKAEIIEKLRNKKSK